METRSSLLQKIMTVPLAAIAVAELLYLRWTLPESGTGLDPLRLPDKPQPVAVSKLTHSIAA